MKNGGVLKPDPRTYINRKVNTSYHAEIHVADRLIRDALKKCYRNGNLNTAKLQRILGKYTIFIYRGEGLESTPCKNCHIGLQERYIRKVICCHKGELIKIRLDQLETEHLSWAQRHYL